ncbi:SH3 domain-containing protein [Candidatus Shapirobacteria bacterium]|nr:SH3 domain-containing protein [Candidatus Shapirobacteria bacterium]
MKWIQGVLIVLVLGVWWNVRLVEKKLIEKQSNKVETKVIEAGTDNQDLAIQIDNLKKEVNELKKQQSKSQVLGANIGGDPTTVLGTGFIKIRDEKWTTIEVFEKPLASAKVVGSINFGKLIYYTKQEPGWYLVEYLDGKYGWVQNQFMEEITE